jgi:hypothetical protein
VRDQGWLRSLKGKRVALVGAAASGVGTKLGAQIDAHDVVVRVNWACPVPAPLRAHLGRRTDTLYHVMRYGKAETVGRKTFRAWKGAGVSLLVCMASMSKPRARIAKTLAAEFRIPFLCVGPLRSQVSKATGTGANTGICALAHMMRSDLAQLSVYAFDFYETGHWLGQANETPAQAAAQAGIDLGHGQMQQRVWVRDLARSDPRLVLLPEIRDMLEQNRSRWWMSST